MNPLCAMVRNPCAGGFGVNIIESGVQLIPFVETYMPPVLFILSCPTAIITLFVIANGGVDGPTIPVGLTPEEPVNPVVPVNEVAPVNPRGPV